MTEDQAALQASYVATIANAIIGVTGRDAALVSSGLIVCARLMVADADENVRAVVAEQMMKSAEKLSPQTYLWRRRRRIAAQIVMVRRARMRMRMH